MLGVARHRLTLSCHWTDHVCRQRPGLDGLHTTTPWHFLAQQKSDCHSLSLSLSLSFGFKFGGNSLRVLRSTQKREIEETRPCSAFGKSSTICRLQIEVKHIYFEFVKFAVVAILFGAPQGIYLGGSSSTSGTK